VVRGNFIRTFGTNKLLKTKAGRLSKLIEEAHQDFEAGRYNRRRQPFFHRGEIADAEPAVPGWSMPVDDLFEPP